MDILVLIKVSLNKFIWESCDLRITIFIVRIALMYALSILLLLIGFRYLRIHNALAQIVMFMAGIISALYIPVEYIRKAGISFFTFIVIASLAIVIYCPKIIASKLSPYKIKQEIIIRVMNMTVLFLFILQLLFIIFGGKNEYHI